MSLVGSNWKDFLIEIQQCTRISMGWSMHTLSSEGHSGTDNEHYWNTESGSFRLYVNTDKFMI